MPWFLDLGPAIGLQCKVQDGSKMIHCEPIDLATPTRTKKWMKNDCVLVARIFAEYRRVFQKGIFNKFTSAIVLFAGKDGQLAENACKNVCSQSRHLRYEA